LHPTLCLECALPAPGPITAPFGRTVSLRFGGDLCQGQPGSRGYGPQCQPPETGRRSPGKSGSGEVRFVEAHNNLGVVYARIGKDDAAAKHYRDAIALNPHLVSARMNFGNLLLQQKKYQLLYRYDIFYLPFWHSPGILN
jgi:tetratricopeptide (TPR) repeat protein